MEYQKLVDLYDLLDTTTKSLEKTYHISGFLRNTSPKETHTILLLLQGRVFPSWDNRKLGAASRLIIKSLATATGNTPREIEEKWKKTGDLGKVAESLIKNKTQNTLFSEKLTIQKVFSNLQNLTNLEGPGSIDQKTKLIAELLSCASPREARYIIRTALEELRIGIGEGTVRDAIVWSSFPTIIGIHTKCKCSLYMPKSTHCLRCQKPLKTSFAQEMKKNHQHAINLNSINEYDPIKHTAQDLILIKDETQARLLYNHFVSIVQEAYDITNDYGQVAEIIRTQGIIGLKDLNLAPGRPIKVMLAIKAETIEEAFKIVDTPAELEYKLDGFRMQIHNDQGNIKIFTRRLEEVTRQFPDVVDQIKDNSNADSYILDAEAIGIDLKTQKYIPFQKISQRIRRKHNIIEMAKQVPIELNIFDIMFYNGKNTMKEPFSKRRELLNSIIKPSENRISIVKNLITDNLTKAQEFYSESLAKGNEGIMFKKLDSIYKPGARIGYMVKLKPIMETLDLVITAAEWGEGKRATWLTSFTLAVIDDNGSFLEIGKVGTGIKEKSEGVSFSELTELLKPLIKTETGKTVTVKPEIVIEIQYEEIQKSNSYKSGYALRFPRVAKIRPDRSPEEISTLKLVKDYYSKQKGK